MGVRYLTVAEAATVLGISQRQVMRWLDKDYFPGAYQRVPGGRWRIPETAVEARKDPT